ncbi:hypothetical protein QAD02_022444 [Eretmocerus hayati]|uniref:Uncharacterized protein n=1 Tax=Eretmocerus hayati TaxID=131215 RepID=A0ACC2PSS7_9HYME|nr:hypothetical protein QAD02_022444 [Eretmocerus hayati]
MSRIELCPERTRLGALLHEQGLRLEVALRFHAVDPDDEDLRLEVVRATADHNAAVRAYSLVLDMLRRRVADGAQEDPVPVYHRSLYQADGAREDLAFPICGQVSFDFQKKGRVMADFRSEVLPVLRRYLFSIVKLHPAVILLVNVIDYLHKGSVAIVKFWAHVFMDTPSILKDAYAISFLDRHLISGSSMKMQRLERLRRGIYYLHQREAGRGEIPGSSEFISFANFSKHTPTRADLIEQEYERILEYSASGPEAFYGVNLGPLDATARLRLTELPLHVRAAVNPHLGASPGVNIPSFYAGLMGSCSAMHCEDGDLNSGNIHRYGAPKYWLFVHPSFNQHLRARVLESLRKSKRYDLVKEWLSGCGTPLHHKRVLLAPSFLREWGIPFEIHIQRPGQFIYIRDGVYHQVVNPGPCIAEAVNMGCRLWASGSHKYNTCACKTPGKAIYVSENPNVAFSVRTVNLKEHKHSKLHLPSGETHVGCSKCKGYVKRDYLRTHQLTCRGTDLSCQYRKKTFGRAANLTNHLPKCPKRR